MLVSVEGTWGQVRLAPRILPGGQMSSQPKSPQVLSSVCHPDRQELSLQLHLNVCYSLEFEGTLCPFFHPWCGRLEDATILQSLSESKEASNLP